MINAACMYETYGTYADDECFDNHDYDDDTDHDTEDDTDDDTHDDTHDARRNQLGGSSSVVVYSVSAAARARLAICSLEGGEPARSRMVLVLW